MRFRIMASRHSAFYTPLLATVSFLRADGHEADYSVLTPGQRSHVLLREGQIDMMQSAVSSNWRLIEKAVEPLPVHFAQINRRDGFFLVGRKPQPGFRWTDLEGKTLLADHGGQPLAMLQYALRHNGAAWDRVRILNAGAPGEMETAFRGGTGDYVHLQAPVSWGEIVASVGASMAEVAFSSICCAREYYGSEGQSAFVAAYRRGREWSRIAPEAEVAYSVQPFFPNTPFGLLTETIERYRGLGTWHGDIEIPRNLYAQAQTVFLEAGAIKRRHSYEAVVKPSGG